ncbi:MAG: MBL fold metallo-hydrolase [Gemmatimonadetes bacterium]|nr:MBL fold metallo-hydrolase [Gemmatimonadota bacterium]
MRAASWFRSLLIPAFVPLACADANDPASILGRTADALGGRDRVRAVRTLVLEGTGENYNLGQNPLPDAELPMFQVNEFRRTIDLENGRWRQDQVRTPTFMTGITASQRQIIALDGDVAFNVAASGTETRAADAVATSRRQELLFHPIGFLNAALAPGAVLRYEARDSAHDVVHLDAGGASQAMVIDRTTRLPVAIVASTAQANLGDVVIETRFADWAETGGLQLPMRITSLTDRWVTSDLRLTAATVDVEVAQLAASDAVRTAAAPAPAVNVAIEDIAPGVWLLAGQSHHSVVIEFADHLMVVEAPQNEARTLAVIAQARELRPDKPVRWLVSTHHHFDHSGGIRAAMAEGITIVAHAASEAFYREIASRPRTVEPDALARAPRDPQIEPVDRLRVFQDASRTVEVHTIEGSPHAGTLLMVYLPAERVLIEADVYSPPAPDAVNPAPAVFAPNLLENVRRLNLRVERIAPIHGRVVPMAMLETAAAAAAAASAAR